MSAKSRSRASARCVTASSTNGAESFQSREELRMAQHRRTIFRIAVAAGIALAGIPGVFAQGAQAPIRIGSTLALTGPLAATSLVHKVVGEIYVEQLNKRGG